MTVEVNILDDGVGIEILALGSVTGQEIIDAHAEINNPSHLKKQKYHIIDRSLCAEYYVSSEEVKIIAKLDVQAAKINSNIIMAIVSSNELIDAIAGLWQVQIQDHVLNTKRFFDRREADEWIKQQMN